MIAADLGIDLSLLTLLEGGQGHAVIGNEDREQGGGLCGAGILAHQMDAARRLEEAFASPIDPRRPAPGHFLATQSGRAPAFRRKAWRRLQLMPKSDGGGKALSILARRNS
jgi:hypothetical protein